MTHHEQTEAARKFIRNWQGTGYERGNTPKFWIDLLTNVFGVKEIFPFIFFEERVKEKFPNKTITNYIDAYIPSTRVMIEQKSSKEDLLSPIRQSDGTMLTPFQQAKRYIAELPLSQHPKWIISCNFKEFLVYDMENPTGEPQQILLKDLEKEYYRLQFLVDEKNEYIRREEEISVQAGGLVRKLYDALIKEYINPDAESLRSLNILCVRIVFCLYAEDAGLFATKTSFEDYIKSFSVDNLRNGMIALFKALDTKLEERDKYDVKLAPFPYVNGGLFRDEQIEIPNFTQENVDVIVNYCAPFNWSDISPTIFGSVFESTLNPDTRRKGGMHYTSIANIHKVIDPLFMDDLREEFHNIVEKQNYASPQKRDRKLLDFQNKIASLTFLDPACGSGNFLTETYLSLRRLENEIISILNKGEKVLGFSDEFIKVNINQFYGIEINDFAVTVAKTALWIAECQMAEETERLIGQDIDFLPLKNHANIVEGNALQLDWATLGAEQGLSKNILYTEKLNIYKTDDFEAVHAVSEPLTPYSTHKHVYSELNVAAKEIEQKEFSSESSFMKPVNYDYIIGNPPFVGARMMSREQKDDVIRLFGKIKNVGNLDYVCCWYKKAADYMKDRHTKTALVSTNSITQGEQVAILWKNLFAAGAHIDFAWRTFRWDSESESKAHVHCVIVGFSCSSPKAFSHKTLYLDDQQKIETQNINGYLIDAPDIFVESRKKTLCPVSEMVFGSMANDGGNLIIEADEYDNFIKNEPSAKKFIRRFLGAEEFINGKNRWCLWLQDAPISEMRKMPLVSERIGAVKRLRASSSRESTRNLAEVPWLFGEIRQPAEGDYLLIPRVSSENRRYIPIGFIDSAVIASDATLLIPNATLYDFGIMTSEIHNAWMRVVAGRLEMRYRYSASLVYNNFPWCNPTEAQKAKIEQTAQAILDVRAKYPTETLADLYDETFMPQDLRKAHRENDRAVMQAYGFDPQMTEEEIVAELFKLYTKLSQPSSKK